MNILLKSEQVVGHPVFVDEHFQEYGLLSPGSRNESRNNAATEGEREPLSTCTVWGNSSHRHYNMIVKHIMKHQSNKDG